MTTARRALVVEDNPATLELARIGLSEAGWDVRTAASVAEALESVSRERFDVILVDLRLPDGDGTELCRTLRSPPYSVSAPIIAYTGLLPERTGAELQQRAGFSRVLVKPVNPESLAVQVEEVVRTASSRSRRKSID